MRYILILCLYTLTAISSYSKGLNDVNSIRKALFSVEKFELKDKKGFTDEDGKNVIRITAFWTGFINGINRTGISIRNSNKNGYTDAHKISFPTKELQNITIVAPKLKAFLKPYDKVDNREITMNLIMAFYLKNHPDATKIQRIDANYYIQTAEDFLSKQKEKDKR